MGASPAAGKPPGVGDVKAAHEGAPGAAVAGGGAQASPDGDARYLGDVGGELQRLRELRVELHELSSGEELRRLGELGLSLRDVRAFESAYVEHCLVRRAGLSLPRLSDAVLMVLCWCWCSILTTSSLSCCSCFDSYYLQSTNSTGRLVSITIE